MTDQGDNKEFDAFVRRVMRAYARRIGEGDLGTLTTLHQLEAFIADLKRQAVGELRSGPAAASWQQIGDALGITRQAAYQKFEGVDGVRKVGGQPAHLR